MSFEQYLVRRRYQVEFLGLLSVLTKYFPNDQIKETEVDHVARMEKEEFITGLGGGIWGKGAT